MKSFASQDMTGKFVLYFVVRWGNIYSFCLIYLLFCISACGNADCLAKFAFGHQIKKVRMKEHTVKMVDSFEGHDDEMVFESFEATAENPVPSEIYVMPQKIHGMGVCICKEGESMISIDKKQYRIGKHNMVIFCQDRWSSRSVVVMIL